MTKVADSDYSCANKAHKHKEHNTRNAIPDNLFICIKINSHPVQIYSNNSLVFICQRAIINSWPQASVWKWGMTNTTEASAQVAELLPSSSGPLATSQETAIRNACTNLLFLPQFQHMLGNINLFLNLFCFKRRRSREKDRFPLVATLQ